MSRTKNVQNALIQALYTAINGQYPIKLPNQPFTTPNGVWLRFTYLPNQPAQIALGSSGLDRITGVFQIDVFAPKSSGRNTSITIVDNLSSSAFKSGVRYTVTGGEVLIRSSGYGGDREESNWYQSIINVEFIADLVR